MSKGVKIEPLDSAIIIAGGGNAARAVALSLAAARLPVMIEPHLAEKATANAPDWQSVLALSPAARTMLETLGIWNRLDQPSGSIWDMQVFGRADAVGQEAGLLSPQLGFAHDGDTKTQTPLGHIVSLAALGRALDAELHHQIETGSIMILPAALADFDAADKTVELTNGAKEIAGLLVDSYRQKPLWRQKQAAQNLVYDYQAAALVGQIKVARPHGQMAAQVFLPSGPLALLPLPDSHEVALVWSLPKKHAQALANVNSDILTHELAEATEGRFGALEPMGALAVQDLHLSLAQDVTGNGVVAIGEAAHVVHPLAGQGFNLTLRDAAVLADTLFEARALGLPFDDASMLTAYARDRQADAALTGATTHGLARLFQGPLAPLGRLGLGLVERVAQNRPSLRAAMREQANAGVAHDAVPRLMRGVAFR